MTGAGWRVLPVRLAIAAIVGFALLWLWFSLDWRMQHDTPLMYYAALLMDEYGRAPYRDFFETSFVGTFLLHLAVVKLVGYSNTAFLGLNVLHVLAVALAGALLMRPFGIRAAIAAPAIFALLYLSHGPSMMLQRDYLVVLPLALALLAATQTRYPWRPASRAVAVGVLFGLAGAIKPQMVLGALPVWVYLAYADGRPSHPSRALATGAGWLAVGGLLVIAPLLGWVVAVGAWDEFRFLFRDYIPLHLALSKEHHLFHGREYLNYWLSEFVRFGGYAWLLPVAAYGVWRCWRACPDPARRHRLALLVGVTGVYALLPGLAGQFWAYHWMPFAWCLSVLVALALPGADEVRAGWRDWLVVAVLGGALTMAAWPNWEIRMQMRAERVPPPLGGRVDEIGAFLSRELRPGDTVQPLDWTGGALHAMLQARAPLATRFLYDYHFYHHPGHPVIDGLRERFLAELAAAPPRFVIEVHDRLHPKDQADAPRFDALRTWLEGGYRVVHVGPDYRIWERR
ncbi:MAG: hypothetical protein H6980_03365 [Gammaproteobacteria bacterium]|nr:hypothetical protein [Gammaproteobacteria bacterium]